LVKNVAQYKTPHTEETISPLGERIVLRGLYIDGTVIIVLQRVDISTMLTNHMRLLKDPSQWDYLLYLETTQAGRMISDLIPGKSPTLLHTKLTLLKVALSARPALISLPHDDLLPTVEIIHHMSARKKLYTLEVSTPERGTEYQVRLFGINHIMSEQDAEGLLEKAHETGTVHIEGVENLSLDTQRRLYEFIRSGSFRPYRGSRTVLSSARIICSTKKDLSLCVSDGSFFSLLYQELAKNSVLLPSIMALPEQEIVAAITDIAQNIPLGDREKEKYASTHRPVSLHELRQRIKSLAVDQSLSGIEPDQNQPTTGDPFVIGAIKLGKQALKDQAIMTLLWNKFQNQTRIATLLGVNRSSVNRRCREYGLISE
jgi:transcriptional regulator of aromatic amino acid metabolism